MQKIGSMGLERKSRVPFLLSYRMTAQIVPPEVLSNRRNSRLLQRDQETWVRLIHKFCGKRQKLVQRVAGIVLWDFCETLAGASEKLSELAWANPHRPVPDVPDAEIEIILTKLGYKAEVAKMRAATPKGSHYYKERRKQWMMELA